MLNQRQDLTDDLVTLMRAGRLSRLASLVVALNMCRGTGNLDGAHAIVSARHRRWPTCNRELERLNHHLAQGLELLEGQSLEARPIFSGTRCPKLHHQHEKVGVVIQQRKFVTRPDEQQRIAMQQFSLVEVRANGFARTPDGDQFQAIFIMKIDIGDPVASQLGLRCECGFQ